ncbi:uncharacterized protein [Anabrus simplex]|uniref:uncharacterized protein isoform X2 n=1 Tax=Anabrus simplex TaxID=316456 RepID=UPI0035A2DD7A
MSNPRKPPSPPPEALRKLAQLQIERLKKEEEEEQWISGEELYTEGSSDEDDAALRAKRRANEGKVLGLSILENKMRNSGQLPEVV